MGGCCFKIKVKEEGYLLFQYLLLAQVEVKQNIDLELDINHIQEILDDQKKESFTPNFQMKNASELQFDDSLNAPDNYEKQKNQLKQEEIINLDNNLQENQFQNQLQANDNQSISLSESSKLIPSILVRRRSLGKNVNLFYKILGLLGQGGFGKVYKVQNLQTAAIRAMKVIKRNTIDIEQQFFEEIEILKNIDHPNIVKILEVFEDYKKIYIISEYCQGGELLERISTITSYNIYFVQFYMKQILSAIQYCHSHKIAHRDLKPENILFECKKPDANLKLIDFGACAQLSDNQQLTEKIGTPYYVAPEILISKNGYNEKCDIWSCGIILYILVFGQPPFMGKNDQETYSLIIIGQYDLKNNDNQNLVDLIQRMLQLDPQKRISAKDAYNHKFIQSGNVEIKLNTKIIQKLGQFDATNKLRTAIQQFITVNIMNEQEQSELLKTFKNLDQNGDGTLSKEELTIGINQVYGSDSVQLVDKIFKELDVNKSGKVDFIEFISATINFELLLTKQKVRASFKLLDINNDGYLTKQELEQLFGKISINDKAWTNILQECDKNDDGKIEEQEFLMLLAQKSKRK